jgi:GH15 family glucan-1,4-alpha-glucosidase
MTPDDSTYPPIGDYALIGDCRSAALVSRSGAIEWLCLPRFDSPSFFAAVLDRDRGGRFWVRPAGEFEVTRRYLGDTAVLETSFEAAGGTLRVTDCFPVASEAEKGRELWPENRVLRLAECTEGEVEVEVLCDPRPGYGRVTPRLSDRGPLGFWYEHGKEALVLRSEVPLARRPDRPGVYGRERLRAGERRFVILVYTDEEPSVVPVFGDAAVSDLERTLGWWSRWVEDLPYDGPRRAAVVRSLVTLKLLTYAPSGAVLAAATCSLPERVGGERNWDYRYCWLRDASITLQGFLDLGRRDEAHAFFSWMLHSTRLTSPDLQVLYDVHGESRLPERELDHLEGYRGSRPVRVGNGAQAQLQLDVYGEVTDAAAQYVRRGGTLSRDSAKLLAGLGEVVCRRWREPDEGIWEVRSGRRHHTHSKVMCWVALDRLLELHEEGQLEVPVERFARERRAIREEVEARGFNREIGSYVSVFDGDEVDASLLRFGRLGFVEPDSERLAGTYRLIEERLGEKGLLYRYRGLDDGLTGGEGAFGIASFWQIDALVRLGRLEEARERFELLCDLGNDVGLFAEEIDPKTGKCLGNFPQAFTHAGLIDAGLTLASALGDAEERGTGERKTREEEV